MIACEWSPVSAAGRFGSLTTVSVVLLVVLSYGCSRSSPPNQPTALPERPSAPPTADSQPAATGSQLTGQQTDAPVTGVQAATQPGEAKVATSSNLGRQLYALHCAACHGERGDGQGIAAVYLFPRPRDFRAGRFRLVSAKNNVPTREDLHAVLTRGMPGSSMPPWNHLSPAERDALVDEVMRLRKDGARELYITTLKEQEGLTDEEIAEADVQEEIQDYADRFTTPGESTEVPDIEAPAEDALARGKEVYAKYGCVQCHGAEGKGDAVQKMFDDEKLPTTARDFTLGIFKGGHDPASLYRRIAYGMPGTPMPSSTQMTPQQMVDLVHFIRALSTEEQRQAAILNRETIVAKAVAKVADAADSSDWSTVPTTALRMTPLWWRNDADPGLKLQAAHDGQTLALRLTWSDTIRDDRAVRPEEFEDMVAAQFSKRGSEPFLGMGAAEETVDLWQWRAGLADTGQADHLMDDYPFDTDVYRDLAGDQPLPDFVTARVAGNPLATRDHNGANLGAKGLGSLTFRPEVSQSVRATGAWKDGVWTVVLTRPLNVSDGEGLKLAAGNSYAVAFAVWDGAARDRAAQKVISIWNDLELE